MACPAKDRMNKIIDKWFDHPGIEIWHNKKEAFFARFYEGVTNLDYYDVSGNLIKGVLLSDYEVLFDEDTREPQRNDFIILPGLGHKKNAY